MSGQVRQLAAIMFTDIVAYTSLMGNDENKAFQLLATNRLLQRPIIERFGGRLIKELGDGVLCTFPTVSEAISAALRIQDACKAVGQFQLRIGIHLAEVVFENDDVFGDGVNVASRIQQIAPPDTIYVSEAVHNNIVNHKEFNAKFVKEERLKNVTEPVKLWEVFPGVSAYKEPSGHQSKNTVIYPYLVTAIIVAIISVLATISVVYFRTLNEPDQPSAIHSIAILPFDDYSQQSDKEWFTAGMTEALITEFSKIHSLNVRSHTSVKQYRGTMKSVPEIARELQVDAVVEGSALLSGDNVRITAQLISKDDSHLWAKEFDGEMKDVLQLHHDIASSIVRGIHVILTREDSARFTRPASVIPAALEADLKGVAMEEITSDQVKEKIKLFQEAIRLDPNYAPGYAHLAHAYLRFPWVAEMDPLSAWNLARQPYEKALALDPNLAQVYLIQFSYLYYIKWDAIGALESLYKAEQLAPNDIDVLLDLNTYYVISGRFDSAFMICNKLDKFHPTDVRRLYRRGWTQFHSRNVEGALLTCNEGLKSYPDNLSLLQVSSWSLSLLGRHEEAVSRARKVLSLESVYFQRDHAVAATVYAWAGLRSEAQKELHDMMDGSHKYIDPFYVGLIYMALGDESKALEFYERGYQAHSPWVGLLRRSPFFDSIRGDKEFQEFISKLKFP